jgi:tetratricopeptide (TPR) repeat protein
MSDAPSRDSVYNPEPIDTSNASLPPELVPLLERLAENAHDVWAEQRLRDGWTLGPVRNDAAKQHPSLVPYDELPESEKTYDRILASQTLRAILVLGYRIVPPATAIVDKVKGVPSFDGAATAARIRAATKARELLDIWGAHRDEDWAEFPELYGRFARRLIQVGEPLLARDVLQVAAATHPSDLRLRHLDGLALARSGATVQAQRVAEQLAREAGESLGRIPADLYEDIYGLLGRTSKELALDSEDANERAAQLERSFRAYQQAFAVTERPYSGINAATMALLSGQPQLATEIARRVRALAESELAHATDDDTRFWQLATLGEAALVLGEHDDARQWYGKAHRASAAIAPGDVGSTRRQARLILAHRGEPRDWMDEVLPPPVVVVFAGHRVDPAGRVPERFPPRAERSVREEIERRLPPNARVGFSGAADGADILFQEIMRDQCAETYVVLPFGEREFVESSVSEGWRRRFDEVKAAATECVVATAQRSVDERLIFGYAHELLLGLAAIHARWIDARVSTLVLWDGQSDDRLVGTAAAVDTWRRAGQDVDVIDIGEVVARAEPVATSRSAR